MKKNIIFFASSAVDLMDLYLVLKPNFNIIWVVYNEGVYNFLKKENIKELHFINFSHKIFNSKNIFNKFIRLFLGLLRIKLNNKNFFKEFKAIEEKYNPSIILTDSGQPLANYTTNSLKINTKHSVCYKKYFLSEVNFKYDYIFLPGYYHEKRIKKIYKSSNINTKFKVVGNIKISQFLKSLNFDKKKIMDKMKLDSNKTNVIFAPSWNAHGKDLFWNFRLMPKNYGNQLNALKKLTKELNLLDCNLIIKLHHASYSYLKKDFFKNLENENNCFIFKSGVYHDVMESNDVFKISDIIITDTSGVASTGAFLKKKLIFMNPHSLYDWQNSDIEKELRPGFVCNSFGEVIDGVKNYINKKDPFDIERKNFVEKIFYNPNEDANIKISKTIDDILSEFS